MAVRFNNLWRRKARGVLLATLLGVSLITSACSAVSKTSPPLPPVRKIAAATYFGNSWPVDFWASDLSYAPADFQTMKDNGFNAVVLVVPWGYFQPDLNANSFNSQAFNRLNTVIQDAKQAGLGVLLRISYEWDMYPGDQQPGNQRFTSVFTSDSVYSAWKSYVSKIYSDAKKFPNFWGGYVSWEDFQSIVLDAKQASTISQRLQLAKSTGFDSWLSQHYKLNSVNSLYHEHFANWNDIPTPVETSPSFRLFYAFWDYQLIHRIFTPALKLFPGLTMETRVDEDPLFNGTSQVGAFSHDITYRLPGTAVTGIYYNPYMGSQDGRIETVDQALVGLQQVLSRVRSQSGGRKLLIYEFQLYDNTPANASNAHLNISSVPGFVTAATPTVADKTTGYAIWTYRDYNANIVYNPDFALGLSSWSTIGNVTTTVDPNGHTVAEIPAGSSIAQSIPLYANSYPNATDTVTVSFAASAISGRSAVTVSVGQYCTRRVDVSTSSTQVNLVCHIGKSQDYNLLLSTTAPVQLTHIQIYSYTQLGDVYSNTGLPEPALQPLQQLNQRMLAS